MQKISVIIVGTFAAVFLAFAVGIGDDTIRFNTWGMGGGKLFENTISISKLKAMPSWNPEKGPPPIGPQEAAKIARDYLKEKHPKFSNAKISDIKLSQFLIPVYQKEKWFYCIIFMNGIPIKKGIPENINVVVGRSRYAAEKNFKS